MFMLHIYRNITGYVKFSGKGVFPERFLNLCTKNNILVWNAKVNVNEMTGCMHINDYKKIKTIAKKSSMRLKIRKRKGLPFIIDRYKNRYGIPIGAAAFFLIIWYLSGFCFNISVSSNVSNQEEKIIKKLKQCGVYCGQRTGNIDVEKARQTFLINNKEYAWAAINIKGSFVTVELTQTTKKKMNKTGKAPCNIVAKTEGKILKIKAYEGKIAAKIGEGVAKGDLIVSGIIELTNKTTKFVHADAEVIAQTRHKLKVFVPYKNTEMIKTNIVEERSVISIAGINIPLFLGEIKEPYKRKQKIKKYKIGGVELPVRKTTSTFFEYKKRKVNLSKSAAKTMAIDKMKKKAKKELKGIIKSDEKGKFKYTDKGVFYTKVYICEENIAKTKKILK